MLPDTLRAHLKADVTVAWPGQAAEACKVFDFATFSETTRDSIYELLTDDDIDRVEDGELVPFAVIGLVGEDDDLEDTTADGVLLLKGEQVLYALAYEPAALIGTIGTLIFAAWTGDEEDEP